MSRTTQLATVVAALGAAFAAGALVYRHIAAPRLEPPGPSESIALPILPDVIVPKSTVPATLPDFTLPDLAGRPHSIREWAGRPLAINFWATWCGPCREEIPLLHELRRERRAEGLEVVGIAVDVAKDVQEFVAKTPIEYPILVGEDDGAQAAAAFGVRELALPFTVFLDRQGRVLALRMGQLHEDQAKLILDALRDVDSGALDLQTAQGRVAAGLRK
jgi:thiol-disulfide isomerase/thioredoxin